MWSRRVIIPDHRCRAALDPTQPPSSDVKVAALQLLLRKEACPLEDVVYAFDLYDNELARNYLDMAFVAKGTPVEVGDVFEVPEEVCTTYEHLFFDGRVFRDLFDRLSYIGTREWGNAKDLVQPAVQDGMAFLKWHFQKHIEVDPRVIAKTIMADTYFRGLQHRRNSIGSAIGKEAFKWLQQAGKSSEVALKQNDVDDRDAASQIHLLLKHKESTKPVTELNVNPNDIVH